MLFYEHDEKKRDRLMAAIAVACYFTAVVVLLSVVNFQFDYVPPQDGILIDFGNAETGLGDDDTLLADDMEAPEASRVPDEQEWMTQDIEEAPPVEQKKPEPSKKTQPVKEQITQPAPAEKPAEREVNKKALFPGNTPLSSSSSQGNSQSSANQGSKSGTVSDNYADNGGSGNGISFSLTGRRPRGEFPRPDYSAQEQGRVVIEISVNANGDVTSANFRPTGSTTSNQSLINAARKAALNAKFSASDNEIQTGTIEYVFKLK